MREKKKKLKKERKEWEKSEYFIFFPSLSTRVLDHAESKTKTQ